MNIRYLPAFLTLLTSATLLWAPREEFLIESYARSIPYRTYYFAFPNQKQAQASYRELSAVRLVGCPIHSANDSCYALIQPRIHTKSYSYALFWPVSSDTLWKSGVVTPAGDTLALRRSNRELLPDSKLLEPINQVVDLYSLKLANYQRLRDEVGRLNLEAAAEATLMAGAWAGTYFLIDSDKKNNRELGYLTASVLTIGLIFDIREYMKRNKVRKNARKCLHELTSWGEPRTQFLIDSLATK